jgi:Caspase domain
MFQRSRSNPEPVPIWITMGNRLFGIAMTIGLAIFMMAFPLDQARAQKKVALVIGNSNYINVPKLPNPARDAISIGQMLRDANFDVVDVVVNASNLELKRAIRKFGQQFSDSGRCEAGDRPRCGRRDGHAGAPGVVGGWCEQVEADYSRRVP